MMRCELWSRCCAWVCVACLTIISAAGCGGTGGTLIPHTYRLLPRAEMLAASSDRFAPIGRELQKTPLEAYFVQPGDVLLLEVTDFEADVRLPTDQPVMPDGTIDLGKYGRIVVAGLTVDQIEEMVNNAVQAMEGNPELAPINVRLTVAESAVFYVLGEINSPGAYPLIGRETVLDAIMTAGGLAEAASECDIILSRPTPPSNCRVVLPVCYNRIVQLGDTTTNYQILPGDRIYVATRSLCDQLLFWRRGCDRCPDCGDRGCPTPVAPIASPFLLERLPPVTEPEDVLPAEPVLERPAPRLPAPLSGGQGDSRRKPADKLINFPRI